MAFYYSLDKKNPVDRRIAERLLLLKDGIKTSIPERTVESNLLVATWNIREFDSPKYGPRSKECLFYIAEIISSFDLVAVQEVNDDLKALNQLMQILGSWWKYLITDVTKGKQGNSERIAFLYDTRKVNFGGLAGEVVLPPVVGKNKKAIPAEQFYRTPYVVGFRSSWFKFEICSVHIVYGKNKANDPTRIKEIEEIATALAKESKGKYTWAKNWILLGDFNIYKTTDKTFDAIINAGFIVPENSKVPTNINKDKYFDQIAFILEDRAFRKLKDSKSGVFDYFQYVYTLADEKIYSDDMGPKYKAKTAAKSTSYYKSWRTFQMSDHMPKWIEVKIDFGKEYLLDKSKP
jgi:endonuclease/exonuclease/phosphatase family metal-dependent hydrolase